jgi:hypothetical protein
LGIEYAGREPGWKLTILQFSWSFPNCPKRKETMKIKTISINDYFHECFAMLSTFPILYIVFLYASFFVSEHVADFPLEASRCVWYPFFSQSPHNSLSFPRKYPKRPSKTFPNIYQPPLEHFSTNYTYIYMAWTLLGPLLAISGR